MLTNRKMLGLGFQEYFFHDMLAVEQKYFPRNFVTPAKLHLIFFFFSLESLNVCQSG